MSAFSMKRPEADYKKGIEHQKYVRRITKTLYYGKLPKTDRLSLPVTELAAELFSEAQCGKSLARLHLNTAASISRNACVSPCSLILAMLYLDKLKSRNPEYLERTSPSDLFLVSLMISSKYLFDDGEFDEVFIDEWATSGGITVSELVELEREFLKAIDWEIYVKDILFWKKFNQLERDVAQREGRQRGFFTYTELANLLTIIEIYSLIQCVVTMTMILVASYTAGVLTIAGSFHLVSHIPGNALKPHKIELNSNVANLDNTIIENGCVNYTDTKVFQKNLGKHVEPVDILRTSLFLASINTFMAPYCNSSDNEIDEKEVETPSWEWWNVPSMIWLSETSQEIYGMVEYIRLGYFYKYFMGYLELAAMTNLEVGNHVNMNKATKTRIQDQLEGSWHQEWTDSLGQGFFYTPYIPNIKL